LLGASSGVSWFLREAFHSLTQVRLPQMRVPKSSFHPFVTQERLYGPQGHSCHDEATGEGVSQVVPTEIVNLGLLGVEESAGWYGSRVQDAVRVVAEAARGVANNPQPVDMTGWIEIRRPDGVLR
jgi:hypothetical protein